MYIQLDDPAKYAIRLAFIGCRVANERKKTYTMMQELGHSKEKIDAVCKDLGISLESFNIIERKNSPAII